MTAFFLRSVFVRNVVGIFFLSASLWLALTAFAHAESITQFTADYHIYADGKVRVVEELVYDFGELNRHGIYRTIKNTHPQKASAWYKERFVDLSLISVTRDGRREMYTLEEDDGLSLKIGKANETITGEHVYRIEYEMVGALSSFRQYAELNWNVTGDEWPVPIHNVLVRIIPESRYGFGKEQACYVGVYGNTDRCDVATASFVGATFSQEYLPPYTGLTVAQSVLLPEPPAMMEKSSYWKFLPFVLLLALLGYGMYLYNWETKYKFNRTVVPQYEPFENFKPMFTGVLYDNKLDARDITAGIVYLAQQGFISIKQTKEKVFFFFETTDYEITLLKSCTETESDFHRHLIELFFGYCEYKTINKIGPPQVRLSVLKEKRGVANAAKIKNLRKDVIKEMVTAGFLEQRFMRGTVAGVAVLFMYGVLYFFGTLVSLFDFRVVVIAFGVILAVTIGLWVGSERRTRRGYEALYYLEGFKDYLSTTEKERYKFHNAPEKNSQQFMEHLPYAIAFGVEKEWAEVFKNIQIVQPGWYGSDISGSGFNSSAFIADIQSFSMAYTGSAASSGGGGFSSGGGFSGGGGGGGGGGSW